MKNRNREIRTRIMKSNRAKDTKPELIVRRALFHRGIRYRIHVKGLPGTPDVAIQKYKLAIQIRGCFWHSHGCGHSSIPKTNRDYWVPKLKRNVERDMASDQKLRDLGFRLFVLWECEIRSKQELENNITSIVRYIEHERNRLTVQSQHM